MMDFKLGTVISTLWKTKEFMIFRFLIYFAITLAYVIGTEPEPALAGRLAVPVTSKVRQQA